MSTLTGNKISLTYKSIFKTSDNDILTAALKQMSDGLGNNSGIYLNTGGDLKSTGILEFANFKGTSTAVSINKLVNEADGISNNDNDTSLPTSAAVKDYVDTHVTTQDLDFKGDSGTGAVDLDSQLLDIAGTTNEITTVALNQKLTIGLPNSVIISGTYTGTTFLGDLSGTINTATTATTQSAGNNSTKVATTAYVDTLDAASDLDFSGTTGTGDVNLNTQSFAVTGTANQIVTAASNQGLQISLLSTGVTMPNGSIATTQSAGDNSTKLATTAYVDVLDSASDLDITGDTGTGAVNLNTQTLDFRGTTNQIITTISGKTATFSLPSTINVNVIGNVTGALTGNADTATKWQTARNLSVSGEATGTIANVDGSIAVSGAVTLTNSAVVGKVLTGLPTPAAGNIQASDSILEAFGKVQSQINSISSGLVFKGSWDAATNTPTLLSGGGEVDSGTTDGATTAFKLIQSGQNFNTSVSIGNKVINQVDGTTALVTVIDSNTQLTLDKDIMLTGEAYTIDASPFIPQGNYYVVNFAGTTNLNGINVWSIGDWVIADADNRWSKLDHSQIDGQGTVGNLPVFSTATTIGDSIVSQSGTALTITGSANTTLGLSSTGNFAVNTNKFTANSTTGNVAFTGDLAINTNKFTVNATSGNVSVGGEINLADNKAIVFGAGGKAFIKHDGSNMSILNDIGNITITNRANDKDIIFDSDNGSGGTTTYFKVDALSQAVTFVKPAYFTDNVKALFGNSSDLQIYHDGSNSYIQDVGTGTLNLQGSTQVLIAGINGQVGFQYVEGGKVGLRHANSEKLSTTNTGIDVTGNIGTSGSVLFNDNQGINFGNSNAKINGSTSDGIKFFGSGLEKMRLTQAGDLIVGSTNPVKLIDQSYGGELGLYYGTTNHWKQYHYSDNSLRFNYNGSGSDEITINTSGDVGIGTSSASSDISSSSTLLEINDTANNNLASLVLKAGSQGSKWEMAALSSNVLGFFDDGTEKMRLDSSGNVSLKNSSSSFGAEVILKGSTSTGTPKGEIAFKRASSDDGANMVLRTSNNSGTIQDVLTLDTSKTSTFAGDVIVAGTGSGNDSHILNFKNSACTIARDDNDLELHAFNAMVFGVSNTSYPTSTERMRITSAGNLILGSVAANPYLAFISTGGNGNNERARISGYADGGTYGGGLQIQTRDSSNVFQNRMRITSTGDFLVRQTSSEVFDTNTGGSVAQFWGNQFSASNSSASKVIIGSASNIALVGGATNNSAGKSIVNSYVRFESTDQTAGSESGAIKFFTPDTGATAAERMIITSQGYTKMSNNGTYNGVTGAFHELRSNATSNTCAVTNTNAQGNGFYMELVPANKSQYLIYGYMASANRFVVWSDGDVQNINNSYGAISDIKLKENIVDATPKLDDLMKVKIRNYNLIGEKQKQIGVIAQELEQIFPSLVDEKDDIEKNKNGEEINLGTTTKSVKYSVFVPMLIKAVQELTAKVERLEKECKCK